MVYILGGFQTDFARNWTKEGKHISAMIREAVAGCLAATGVAPDQIDVGHVGNFAAELYSMQGHLGAFLRSGSRPLYSRHRTAPPDDARRPGQAERSRRQPLHPP